jgi:hypothetical protein
LPSAENAKVAAVLIAGAPSERMKVFAEPAMAAVPTWPVGVAPVEVDAARLVRIVELVTHVVAPAAEMALTRPLFAHTAAPPYAPSKPVALFSTKALLTPTFVIEVDARNVAAEMFAVLVVLPSAENAKVAAWLIAGAPSERMKVEAEPAMVVVPTEALGVAPLVPVGHEALHVPARHTCVEDTAAKVDVPEIFNVAAEMFAVLVVLPSALKEYVAAWLIAGHEALHVPERHTCVEDTAAKVDVAETFKVPNTFSVAVLVVVVPTARLPCTSAEPFTSRVFMGDVVPLLMPTLAGK